MTSVRVSRIHRGLIASLVTIYLAAGLAGFLIDFDTTGDRVLWIAFLCGGAAFILLGSVIHHAPAWLSQILVSAGAIAGAIALIWTVVVPLAAAVLVALTFSLSRRTRAA